MRLDDIFAFKQTILPGRIQEGPFTGTDAKQINASPQMEELYEIVDNIPESYQKYFKRSGLQMDQNTGEIYAELTLERDTAAYSLGMHLRREILKQRTALQGLGVKIIYESSVI